MSWLSNFLNGLLHRPTKPPVKPPDTPTGDNLLDAVNAARNQRGLRPLQPDDKVKEVCLRHCRRMFEAGTLSHRLVGEPSMTMRLVQAEVSWVDAGECVAQGQRTAEEAVEDWLNHGPHRVIVLDRDMTHGALCTVGGYWCLDVVEMRS